MKRTACEKGFCNKLFDDNASCDFQIVGKLEVCDHMSQSNGRCLSRNANQPKRRNGRRTNNDAFRNFNVAFFDEYNAAKGGH